MIRDWSQLRVFVRPGTTDMRKQINGLAALVRDQLGRDPLDGSLYLFDATVTGSRFCTGTATVFVCGKSVWRKTASLGPRTAVKCGR